MTPFEGVHLIADLAGIPAARLSDPEPILAVLVEALGRAGFSVLEARVHRFSGTGAGFTAMVLLAESHAAVHTYPEHGYLALDVFGCGSADPEPVLAALAYSLGPCTVERRAFIRRPPKGGPGTGREAR